ERLAAFRRQLLDQGVTAGGEIGDRDPVNAVRDCARDLDVSEVILSTLPAGRSKWLRQDVPSRMKGAMNVPVTVVAERAPANVSHRAGGSYGRTPPRADAAAALNSGRSRPGPPGAVASMLYGHRNAALRARCCPWERKRCRRGIT